MATNATLTCAHCGAGLTAPARGRRPRYCSRACQARAYRARTAARDALAPRETEPSDERHDALTAGETARGALSLDRIVGAGIAIADAEGLEALSMRRVAADLGAGTMSLYRYVPGKDELIDLMAGVVLEEADPGSHPRPGSTPPAEDDWRPRLASYARLMWAVYRRHPWVLQILSVTRPRLVPGGLAKTEWLLRGVQGLSHDLPTMIRAAVTVTGYVQGMAMFLVNDIDAERRTGVGKEQWWESNRDRFQEVVTGGPYPILARIVAEEQDDVGLDEEFEFGLQRMLDGLAVHLGETR
jgi:AcrR family transcriptional regulator